MLNLTIIAQGAAIVLIDLVLSGDNALVIGAAAARLPLGQQRRAIIWGGVFALVLRFALAVAATELLRIPLLSAFGGVVVLAIAVRLALPERDTGPGPRGASARIGGAILTIVVADVTMSLDNVLAIGALAAGNVILLAVGLVLSMSLLFAASAVVAVLIRRLWWLLDLAVIVLGWTAAHLIIGDGLVMEWFARHLPPAMPSTLPIPIPGPRGSWLVYGACFAVAVIADLWFHFVPQVRAMSATPGADQKPRPATPTDGDSTHDTNAG
jgi:YjbE family integral membrane protein